MLLSCWNSQPRDNFIPGIDWAYQNLKKWPLVGQNGHFIYSKLNNRLFMVDSCWADLHAVILKWSSIWVLMKYLLFINLCHKTVPFHWWSSEVWQFKDQKLLIVVYCWVLIFDNQIILFFAELKRSKTNKDSWPVL